MLRGSFMRFSNTGVAIIIAPLIACQVLSYAGYALRLTSLTPKHLAWSFVRPDFQYSTARFDAEVGSVSKCVMLRIANSDTDVVAWADNPSKCSLTTGAGWVYVYCSGPISRRPSLAAKAPSHSSCAPPWVSRGYGATREGTPKREVFSRRLTVGSRRASTPGI